MSPTVELEQSPLISDSYEEPLCSMAPPSGEDPAAQVCHPAAPADHFTASASTLSFETPIILSRPLTDRDTRTTVTLEVLLVAAGSDAPQEATRAQQELAAFLQRQMPRFREGGVDQCFADSSQDISNALTQLLSADPADRQAGAFTISTHILNGREDMHLRRGLVISLAKINNVECRRALVDIYRQSRTQPELKQVFNFHNNHQVLALVAQGQGVRPADSPGTSRSLPVAGLDSFSGGSREIPTTSLASSGVGSLSQASADLAAQVLQIVNQHLHSAGIDSLFSTPQMELVAQRIARMAGGSDPAMGSVSPFLPAIVMAPGFHSPLFTSAQHFGPLQQAAHGVARSVSQLLENRHSPSANFADGQITSQSPGATELAMERVHQPDHENHSAPAPMTIRGVLDYLVSLALRPEYQLASTSPSLSTTTYAGMQGYRTIGHGGILGTQSLGLDGNPTYYVDATTNVEGDANHGFGSQSQGGHPQDQQNPQDSPQPDSYA